MHALLPGNHAAAEGARLARVEVVAAYPITPQTQIVERLAEWVATGQLRAEFIKVESEHSAMAACIGAAAVGARTFTATSAQGLVLMHELLHWAAGGRYPVVLCNVNRSLAHPWNIWSDHTDSMSQRDTGVMQLHCENNQDVLDFVLWAFRTAEALQLPAMVNLDAFTLSHCATPVAIPEPQTVDAYLPPYRPRYRLDPTEPISFGNVTAPEPYFEFRREMEAAMRCARQLFDETGRQYGERFGRPLQRVRFYRCEDAEQIIILTGSVAGTAQNAVDRLRERGVRVGLAAIHVYRPFPIDLFLELARGGSREWVVLDRSISFGMAGPIFCELGTLLGAYLESVTRPRLLGFVGGLGGVDIVPDDFERMITRPSQEKTGPVQWLS